MAGGGALALATRHPVDFLYTPQELVALFRYANENDVDLRWESPALRESETDECFAPDDLMADPGRWELQALGRVKHGDVPSRDVRRDVAD